MNEARAATRSAAALALIYATTLAVGDVVLVTDFLRNDPNLSAAHSSHFAERGLVLLALGLLTGAACLGVGSVQLVRAGRGQLIVVPLAALLAIGIPGEIVDAAGGASSRVTVVGAAILALAVAPIILIVVSRRRAT